MKLLRCLGAVLVLVLGLASAGLAQQMDTALILGTVSDTTGAVIPGVSVTFNHVETGTTYTSESNESGSYRSNPLRIGTYLVIVESDGFKTYSGSGINLSIGDVRQLDVSLEIGAVTEVIEEGKNVTYDMKPDRNDPTAVGTQEMAAAICAKM